MYCILHLTLELSQLPKSQTLAVQGLADFIIAPDGYITHDSPASKLNIVNPGKLVMRGYSDYLTDPIFLDGECKNVNL